MDGTSNTATISSAKQRARLLLEQTAPSLASTKEVTDILSPPSHSPDVQEVARGSKACGAPRSSCPGRAAASFYLETELCE